MEKDYVKSSDYWVMFTRLDNALVA